MTKKALLDKLEAIVSDDASEDLAMKAAFPGVVKKSDFIAAVDKLGLLYCILHSHNRSHSCYHVHSDWRKL